MTARRPGVRVRIRGTGPDGLPTVHYGVIDQVHSTTDDTASRTTGRETTGHGATGHGATERVLVLLDDADHGPIDVPAADVDPIGITDVDLRLEGDDLLDVPELRSGLARLWAAEAARAGVEVAAFHPTGNGLRDSSEGFVVAEVTADGEHYVVRAVRRLHGTAGVHVRAERPNRWDY